MAKTVYICYFECSNKKCRFYGVLTESTRAPHWLQGLSIKCKGCGRRKWPISTLVYGHYK
jgi:predicted CxxxxCH...CXXCH cytochrome family protein